MKEGDLTRRSFVKQSALAAVTTLPLASTPAESAAPSLKIVCVGAHPDDPESGCGGTLASGHAHGSSSCEHAHDPRLDGAANAGLVLL